MDFKELFGEELSVQIEGIVKEKGVNLIVDNKENPNYIPKDRFNEVIGSKNELKAQVGELTSHLEELKKTAKGNEELTKTIEELQSKNNEWSKMYQNKILEDSIKFKALQEKAIDINDLTKFIDYKALEIAEDGSIKGLDEQIASLKENKGYLFEQSKQVQNNEPMNPAGGSGNKLNEVDKYHELLRQSYDNPNNKQTLVQLFAQKRKLK